MSEEKVETERKNFSTQTINEVFEDQGRMCAKCGNALMSGFHAHHKNGDSSDNSKENCALVCRTCHGGEQYKTLKTKKEALIGDLTNVLKKGSEGQLAGSLVKELKDVANVVLRLQKEVSEDSALEPPADVKLQYYIATSEYGMKKFEEGFEKGLTSGVDIRNKVK